jgi:hypothetical protein
MFRLTRPWFENFYLRRFPRVSGNRLSLTLFMLCDFADNPHLTVAVDDLALVANLLD